MFLKLVFSVVCSLLAVNVYAGDAVRGEGLFKNCIACHSIEQGKNKVGPSLAGVVGRRAGTVSNFRYSRSITDSDVTWTREQLNAFLKAPKNVIPGIKMAFAGIKDAAEREDIIEFLSQH